MQIMSSPLFKRFAKCNRAMNPGKLTRREFLRLGGLSAAGALLAACQPLASQLIASTDQPLQLVYQDWRTDWFPPMVQEMLAKFHETHPEINVFYVPDPVDVEQSLLVDLQTGTGPDVFAACCSFFPILAQERQTLDLRPYVGKYLDKTLIEDWDPAQYNSLFTSDGRQYGLPKYHGALALYYNKDLFDQYGVDYPDDSWNQDDYLEAMKRLTHDRDGDGKIDLWGSMVDVSWDRIQVHVNAWGGNFVDPNDSHISRMGEPEALAAMEWLRARMWDDHVMASFLDVHNMGTRQAFAAGKVAMTEDGSWALKDILNEANFRIGVAPMPAGPARRVSLTTTDGFGIYANTRHTQEAWELLRFLISEDYSLAMARANFLQPARASLIDKWDQIIRQEFPEKTKDMNIAVFADGQIKGYSVVAEVFANMTEATRLATEAWDQIFTLGQAPVSIMKDVSAQIEKAQQAVG
jgi:multiple sugar transport system substrate-binding protein